VEKEGGVVGRGEGQFVHFGKREKVERSQPRRNVITVGAITWKKGRSKRIHPLTTKRTTGAVQASKNKQIGKTFGTPQVLGLAKNQNVEPGKSERAAKKHGAGIVNGFTHGVGVPSGNRDDGGVALNRKRTNQTNQRETLD